MAAEAFDVVVVGGGITGAGVALDAASRGLRTALVEKGDFGSGTSSRSSKFVHGGLRYLHQREYRLVLQSLSEQRRLLGNAPHLVRPVPVVLPVFAPRRARPRHSAALALHASSSRGRDGCASARRTPRTRGPSTTRAARRRTSWSCSLRSTLPEGPPRS
ncbi:MAG: FAD-dependent oxidoreductase [Actinomycetota bacterium]|nr:FAD-dependent oxidoreductase [Actinomycetota bacterium]